MVLLKKKIKKNRKMIWLVILLVFSINIALMRRKQKEMMIGIKRFNSNLMKLALIQNHNKNKIILFRMKILRILKYKRRIKEIIEIS